MQGSTVTRNALAPSCCKNRQTCCRAHKIKKNKKKFVFKEQCSTGAVHQTVHAHLPSSNWPISSGLKEGELAGLTTNTQLSQVVQNNNASIHDLMLQHWYGTFEMKKKNSKYFNICLNCLQFHHTSTIQSDLRSRLPILHIKVLLLRRASSLSTNSRWPPCGLACDGFEKRYGIYFFRNKPPSKQKGSVCS